MPAGLFCYRMSRPMSSGQERMSARTGSRYCSDADHAEREQLCRQEDVPLGRMPDSGQVAPLERSSVTRLQKLQSGCRRHRTAMGLGRRRPTQPVSAGYWIGSGQNGAIAIQSGTPEFGVQMLLKASHSNGALI